MKNFTKFLKGNRGGMMKVLLVVVGMVWGVGLVWGQTASATWALSSNLSVSTTGNITASSASYAANITTNSSFTGSYWGTAPWSTAASPDFTKYIQFDCTPSSNNKFTFNSLSFNHYQQASGTWNAVVYYSLDNWVTSTQIGTTISVATSSATFSVNSLNIPVLNFKTLSIRVFVYNSNTTYNFKIANLVISGTTTTCNDPVASAGSALAAICQSGTSSAMGGNVSGSATGGTWTGGAGIWTNANNPSTATYTSGSSESGIINLTLTTSGGSCGTTTATKTINVAAVPTTANAGNDISIPNCASAAVKLGANTPTTGTGAWSVVSGPSTSSAQFSSTSSSNSTFTPAGGVGTYTLRWTISNGACASSTDDVVITVGSATSYSGTLTVGNGGYIFSSLTDAISKLTTCGYTGNIILELQTNYDGTSTTETFPIAFASTIGSTSAKTITIRPASSANGLTINNTASSANVSFNGVSYITFDGRPGGIGGVSSNELSIVNTGTGAGATAAYFYGDAKNNNINYCILKSLYSSETSGVINFLNGSSTGNSNNSIDHCIIDGSSTAADPAANNGAVIGVYSNCTSGGTNTSNTLRYNEIRNVFMSASATTNDMRGVYLNSGNQSWTISYNRFYDQYNRTPSSYGPTFSAIEIASGDSYTLNYNNIGGKDSTASISTPWTITCGSSYTFNFYGMKLAFTNSTNASEIQGNVIKSLKFTQYYGNTSSFDGIKITAGKVNIGNTSANYIGDNSVNCSTYTNASIQLLAQAGTTTAVTINAINVSSTQTNTISNNVIGGFVTSQRAAADIATFTGINTSGTGGSYTISNNVIGSSSTSSNIVIGYSSSTGDQGLYGINNSATGTISISSNSINNLKILSTGASTFSAIYNSGGATSITSNTISSITTGSVAATSAANNYMIYNSSALAVTISSNSVSNITIYVGDFYGIYDNSAITSTSILHTISSNSIGNSNNNNISLNQTSASTTVRNNHGIYVNPNNSSSIASNYNSPSYLISDNFIRNFTQTNDVGYRASFVGINIDQPAVSNYFIVRNNNIYNLKYTNTTSRYITVTGISLVGNSTNTFKGCQVEKNKVYGCEIASLPSSTSSFSTFRGIYSPILKASGTAHITNNFVYFNNGSNSNGLNIVGMSFPIGTSGGSPTVYVVYNTVYIENPTGLSGGDTGPNVSGGGNTCYQTAFTYSSANVYNNIFYNNRTSTSYNNTGLAIFGPPSSASATWANNYGWSVGNFAWATSGTTYSAQSWVTSFSTDINNYNGTRITGVNMDGSLTSTNLGYVTTTYNASGITGCTYDINDLTTNRTVASGGTSAHKGCYEAASPTITLASNTISAASFCQSATKQPIQSFSLAVTNGNGNLTNLSFTTTGTYVQADVTKYQLWYGTTNVLSSAVQLGSDLSSIGGDGARTFAAFTSPTLTNGQTYYFWITADITASATNNNTIAVNAIETINLTSTSVKAGSTSAGGTQTLKSLPTAGSALSAICQSGTSASMGGSIGGGATSGTWSGGVGSWTNASNASTATYTAGSSESGSITLTLTVSGGACGTATATKSITVNARPTITGSSSVCMGLTLTLTGSGTAATSNAWSSSDVTKATINTTTTTGTVTAVAAGTTNITYTDNNGCSSTPSTITVGSRPSTAVLAGDATICNGSSSNLTVTVTGGTSPYTVVYTGNGGGTVNSYTSGNNISQSPSTTTTYGLTSVTDANGCTASSPSGAPLITVNQIPTATWSATATSVCYNASAQTTTLAYSATTNTPTSYSITWNASPTNSFAAVTDQANTFAAAGGSGNISISIPAGTAAGTYTGTITVKNANSCTSTSSNFTVTVNSLPTALVLTGSTVCSGETTTITSTTSASGVNYLLYNSSNATVGSSEAGTGSGLTWSSAVAGTGYYVIGTNATTNCTSTSNSVNIVVNSLPTLTTTGTINAVNYNASAQSSSLTYTASTNSPISYSIDWSSGITDQGSTNHNFSGGSSISDIAISAGVAAGSYSGTMTFTTAAGCSGTQAVTIVINSGATTFYYLGSGLMNSTSSWWSGYSGSAGSYTGTGTHPTDITSGSHIFYVYADLTTNATWTLGSGSKIVVGNGTNATTLTLSNAITGTIDVANNGTLVVGAGSPTLGTLHAGSTVAYTGSSAQTIPSGVSFGTLTINNSNGVALGGNTTVTGTLNLTSGKLTIPSSTTLTLGTTSSNVTINGGSSSNYIVTSGSSSIVKRYINTLTSYVFPIGDATYYTPMTYTLNSHAGLSSDYLSVYVVDGITPGFVTANFAAYISRYWSVTPSWSAASNYDISYTYDDTDVNGTESTIVPVKVSSGTWYKPTNAVNITNGTAQGTGSINTGTNTLTWASLTSHSFDTGAGDEAAALPIHLLYFTAKPQSNRVRLDWATASETNNDYFTVERSQDGEHFNELFKKPGAGISTTNLYYFGYDNKPLAGTSYYRLKQTDFDGKFEYSEIESVSLQATVLLDGLKVYPNPSEDNVIHVDFSSESKQEVTCVLHDAVGKEIATEVFEVAKGPNEFTLSYPSVATGMYILEIRSSEGGVQQTQLKLGK
jgi:hypothetical protein